MLNYPLKFTPILKEKIWGGNKLKNLLNKKSESNLLGESWEISGVPNNISKVENGQLKGFSLIELIKEYKSELVGNWVFQKFGAEFPLLIKFIDAEADLSVQVHPDDNLAKERHQSFGKTEMWYIMQADKNARINIGFQENIDKAIYLTALQEKNIVDLLNFERVKEGDAFFINTGKVHAIGAGVLLAEIQQTSDITYRIYDWDRVDENGESRELHTALALDAIDFEKRDEFILSYSEKINQNSNLARCEYFTTNLIKINGELTQSYFDIDSFVILMCVEGKAEVLTEEGTENINRGETLLIPAALNEITIRSENARLLEVFLEEI